MEEWQGHEHFLFSSPPPSYCRVDVEQHQLKNLIPLKDDHQKKHFVVFLFLGLASFPQHELAKKQMTGFGGMVTFFIKGDLENAKQFFKSSEVTQVYKLS